MYVPLQKSSAFGSSPSIVVVHLQVSPVCMACRANTGARDLQSSTTTRQVQEIDEMNCVCQYHQNPFPHHDHRRIDSIEQSLPPNGEPIDTQFSPPDDFGDFNAFQGEPALWDLMLSTNLYEFPSPVFTSPTIATTSGLSPSVASTARLSAGPHGERFSKEVDSDNNHGSCHRPNSCYALAFSTSESLHTGEASSLTPDSVFRRNKKAIGNVTDLLKCPCS